MAVAAVATSLLLSSGVAEGAGAAPQPAELHHATMKQDVQKRTYQYYPRYGNATTLDLYTPPQARGRHGLKLPTIVLVHGGAWQMGKRTGLAPQAYELARKGFVVVSVNYRYATQAPWPAQRVDVSRAVTYLRKHAASFNVDRKRVVLLGSSAGGHIAAAVATHGAGKKRFRGVISLSGLLNPLTVFEQDPDYYNAVVPEMLLRCTPSECPDRYRSAIPATALDRRDVPSLLFHAQDEEPWGPEQSVEFVRASRAVGVPSKLRMVEGSGHGFEYWERVHRIVIQWIVNHTKR
jgi:acetyl esterase/lipase